VVEELKKLSNALVMLLGIIGFSTCGYCIFEKMSGEMIFNPLPLEMLEEGDVIVTIGKKDDLKRMKDIL